VDCSAGGVCLEDLRADLRAARVEGGDFQSLERNQPPLLSLLSPAGLAQYVDVRNIPNELKRTLLKSPMSFKDPLEIPNEFQEPS
jgi:hypothetical protein